MTGLRETSFSPLVTVIIAFEADFRLSLPTSRILLDYIEFLSILHVHRHPLNKALLRWAACSLQRDSWIAQFSPLTLYPGSAAFSYTIQQVFCLVTDPTTSAHDARPRPVVRADRKRATLSRYRLPRHRHLSEAERDFLREMHQKRRLRCEIVGMSRSIDSSQSETHRLRWIINDRSLESTSVSNTDRRRRIVFSTLSSSRDFKRQLDIYHTLKLPPNLVVPNHQSDALLASASALAPAAYRPAQVESPRPPLEINTKYVVF
ncbi:hypothetical protein DB88DRAFT_475647 [Papiliotrema laurentii]|uniref:Uncharacterized protein n=1 Tax=Papiliotrema laurentii TaxID=5418 RepID=A0AAD9CX49_PAPLA|nr:hypothetical protein DB88DRAFT_475695 [Papiliotrema laurentii]KAK1920721.1 hypothetical protein DB88DRAFT_475647 [Papiliotrema laurentii]